WSATYRLVTCTIHEIGRRVHPNRIFRAGVLNSESEAFRLMTRVVQEFATAARSIGAEPVVLMLPGLDDVERLRETKPSSYEPLQTQIDPMGIRVIDAGRALASTNAPLSELFAPGGHNSPQANAAVAEMLAESLQLPRRT